MKIIRSVILEIVTMSFVFSIHAQGTFQNLNFESANPGTTFSFGVPVSSALPGWTVTIGGVQQTDVGVNTFSTGAPAVSLIAPGGPVPAIDGNYSVFLTGSTAVSSISQSGLIPSGMESLFFDAQQGTGGGGNGTLSLMVGNQTVPITPVETESGYTVYGANISAWAGDPEQLTFSASEATSGLNNWTLDDISFSPTATPEPNTLALIVMGGAAFAVRQWRKRG
jgi:hypothetical protein